MSADSPTLEMEMCTLGEIAEELEESSDQVVLDRLMGIMDQLLPLWRLWKVNPVWWVTKYKAVDFQLSPKLIDEMRFVFPTRAIIKAFDPTDTQVTKKKFTKLKNKLLEWAFCRALVIEPKLMSYNIHGSKLNYNLFIAELKCHRERHPGPLELPDSATTFDDLVQLHTYFHPEVVERIADAMDDVHAAWRAWRIVSYSTEKLLGDANMSNIFRKIKFVLSDEKIAAAFRGPGPRPGKLTTKMKLRMLTWPLGRALIRYPLKLAYRIHSTPQRFRLFMALMRGIDQFPEEDAD